MSSGGSTGQAQETPAGGTTHDAGVAQRLAQFMTSDWDDSLEPIVVPDPIAPHTARRRALLSARFPGEVLVIPTGRLKVRANDTDYPFRAGSNYYWLTGDLEPDGVLVMVPAGTEHSSVLHIPARSDRAKGGTDFFTDRRHGELWVGPRHGPTEVAQALAIQTAPRDSLAELLASHPEVRLLRGLDQDVDDLVPIVDQTRDDELATTLSELRLIKDDLEIALLEEAVAATVIGFEECVRELRAARALPNGERWLEGTFWRRARTDGNDVGYGSIVACGHHATTLHWTRDDGLVRDGDLALLDMGVESRSLYTADITRTLPVSGRFTPAQRKVYDAVYEAQQAALAVIKPGTGFLDAHKAAMVVLVRHLRDWGLLSEFPDDEQVIAEALHRRYTLHGVSHHLGLDVHDCAQARNELYRQGTIESGMVFTVEPGLYFQRDDLTVPEELRGIGVRIEDDIMVTGQGCRVLSAALPTEAGAVEAWMDGLIRGSATDGHIEVVTASYDAGEAASLRAAQEHDLTVRYRGGEPSRATAEQFTKAARGRFLLALLDGAPAGCVGIRVEPDALAAGRTDVAELKRMFTAPWARRRGVGSALLMAAEAAARQLGFSRVILESGDQQPEALALYQEHGYEPADAFGPYKCHPDAHHLGKDL